MVKHGAGDSSKTVLDPKTTKKELLNELTAFNQVGIGSIAIDKYKAGDIDNRKLPSKPELIELVQGIYSLAKRSIECIQTDSGNSGEPSSLNSADEIMKAVGIIKDELVSILPGLVKDAVDNNMESGKSKVSQNSATVEQVPVERHMLEVKLLSDDASNTDGDDVTESEWTRVVKKDVTKKLKTVPVVRANKAHNGSAKLEFKTKEDMEEASKVLSNDYRVNSSSEVEKKLDPKITIFEIDADSEVTSKESLLEEILAKNADINMLKEGGDLCKAVFFDEKERFGVLQVSPAIREVVRKNNDRVCIGLQMYNVKDRFHVVQCYNCQGFGHTSSFCKKKDNPTCFYCGEAHMSKSCQHKKDRKRDKMCCTNCSHSKNKNERDHCHSHRSSDTNCPFFMREKERVISRTAYPTEVKNEHLQRVRDQRIKRNQKVSGLGHSMSGRSQTRQ